MASTQSAFYVSTKGNDSWSGTLAAPNAARTDGPFASLEKARAAMEASESVKTTYLRGGLYRLDQTLELDAGDAGQSWLAYAGEKPVITGGTAVSGWTIQPGGSYAAKTTASGLDVSLVNNANPSAPIRLLPSVADYDAAAPTTSGWHLADPTGLNGTTQFHFQPGDLLPGKAQAGMHIHVISNARWQDTLTTIKSIDWTTRTITVNDPVAYGIDAGTTWQIVADPAGISKMTGSFAWRASDGALIYRPKGSFLPVSQTVEVAKLETLIHANDADGLKISGLTFINTKTGYEAAIRLDETDDAVISGNKFTAVGEAVRLNWGSDNVSIAGNSISSTGYHAIEIIHSDGAAVTGNTISDVGVIKKDGSAVFLGASSDTLIDRNVISEVGRAGVSISSWGTEASTDNVVSNNVISGTARETADTGAIYLYSGPAGQVDLKTLITANKITDIRGLAVRDGVLGPSLNTMGINLDDGVSGVTISRNLIIDAPMAAVSIHGGSANVIDNNIAILPDSAVYNAGGTLFTGSDIMYWNGDLNFATQANWFTARKSKITVDAWADNPGTPGAHFQVLVDGVKIGEGTTTATSAATAKSFSFSPMLTAGVAHTVTVRYDNDAEVGGLDRNLHVKSINVNGQVINSQPTGAFIAVQPSDMADGTSTQPDGNVVTHNIISTEGYNVPQILNLGATDPFHIYDHNILDNVTPANIPGFAADTHSLQSDPHFANAEAGNYHLLFTTPAWGMGYAESSWVW